MSRTTGGDDAANAPVRLEPATPPWRGRTREALTSTDWDDHAIVDVVRFAPASSLGFEDDQRRVEVYRYERAAPPPDTYATPERTVRVERVTRPLYDRRS